MINGGKEDLSIYDEIDVQNISLNLKSSDKNGIIRELARPLLDSEHVLDKQGFLEDLFAREEKGSTGIGEKIAIPHCRTEHVDKFMISIGRKQEGIDFDSIDDENVHIFFLFAIPKKNMQTYLILISHLSKILKKSDFLEKFLNLEKNEELIELLKSTESHLD